MNELRKRAKHSVITGVLILVLVTIVVGYGLFTYPENRRFIKACSAETSGRVISVEKRKQGGRSGSTYYYIDIEPEDKTIFTDTVISHQYTVHKHMAGDVIKLYYDPTNSNRFYIEEEPPGLTVRWMAGVFLLGGGAAALFIRSGSKRLKELQ